jgi:pyruvate formate lyase activating enzyme
MKPVSRRKFLYCSAGVFTTVLWNTSLSAVPGLPNTGSGPDDIRGNIFKGDAPDIPGKFSRKGAVYQTLANGSVICGICPHRCLLAPGDRSVCRSRVNIDGVLYSLAYGNPCAVHVDPVEKKPLYHFMPGTKAFSIAAAGCNLRCLNCQNWEISQAKPRDVRQKTLFPDDVVKHAEKSGCGSIAYTYSEPISFYEYMMDTAAAAKAGGIHNILISAGYINRAPLMKLCDVLDAANVNLKSFSETVYLKLNGAHLAPVLDTFKTLHERGVHFEMTNLVVPGYTDDPEMVKRMCDWILTHLGPDNPLHFLRFFPRYKLRRLAPTPVSTLSKFRKLAMTAGIRYVYVGNVPDHEGNNTYCHQCKRLLVRRKGYFMPTYNIVNSNCRFCNTRIPGVWEPV